MIAITGGFSSSAGGFLFFAIKESDGWEVSLKNGDNEEPQELSAERVQQAISHLAAFLYALKYGEKLFGNYAKSGFLKLEDPDGEVEVQFFVDKEIPVVSTNNKLYYGNDAMVFLRPLNQFYKDEYPDQIGYVPKKPFV